jgi:hypothetical protein
MGRKEIRGREAYRPLCVLYAARAQPVSILHGPRRDKPAIEGAHHMGDLIYLALGVVLFAAFGAYAWLLRGL